MREVLVDVGAEQAFDGVERVVRLRRRQVVEGLQRETAGQRGVSAGRKGTPITLLVDQLSQDLQREGVSSEVGRATLVDSHGQIDPRAHENTSRREWISFVAQIHHESEAEAASCAVSGEDLCKSERSARCARSAFKETGAHDVVRRDLEVDDKPKVRRDGVVELAREPSLGSEAVVDG